MKNPQLPLWAEDKYRTCTACHLILPLDQFYPKRSRVGGYFTKCKECERQRGKKRYYNNLANEASRKVKAHRLDKIAAFTAYGGCRCSCCGEEHLVFLSLDHIEGGGSKWRKVQRVPSIYGWLRYRNYPPGFQVLCFNCNWAKSHGGCPHKYQEGIPLLSVRTVSG